MSKITRCDICGCGKEVSLYKNCDNKIYCKMEIGFINSNGYELTEHIDVCEECFKKHISDLLTPWYERYGGV